MSPHVLLQLLMQPAPQAITESAIIAAQLLNTILFHDTMFFYLLSRFSSLSFFSDTCQVRSLVARASYVLLSSPLLSYCALTHYPHIAESSDWSLLHWSLGNAVLPSSIDPRPSFCVFGRTQRIAAPLLRNVSLKKALQSWQHAKAFVAKTVLVCIPYLDSLSSHANQWLDKVVQS